MLELKRVAAGVGACHVLVSARRAAVLCSGYCDLLLSLLGGLRGKRSANGAKRSCAVSRFI